MDAVYAQFVEAVARGRGMDVAAVEALAQGRVYTGREVGAARGRMDGTGEEGLERI